MQFINKINNPNDLKKFSLDDLNNICRELRNFTIESVSKTGGHLGASLGVVELTVALHYIFNAPDDKIIWDVGHQAYPHKILTERKSKIHTLRKKNGLSGFTKRSESIYDPFGAAHSSTSLSANLGMTVARDILKKKFDVVSIIGDGAISAGMAFEGLNNIGHLNKNSLIILNDNEMSIAKPVGAMSNYLVKLLSSKTYTNVKDVIKKFTSNLPPEVESFAKKTEEYLKGYITGNTLFEELGLNYIGPIDGHNVNLLAELFKKFKDKELTGPIFLHLVTEKGRGYAPAEQSSDKFHGVSSFDISSGLQKKSTDMTYTKVVGKTLLQIGKLDKKVVAITAAMPGGTGIADFQSKFPDRCFDVGIAEQHGVTFAAALAAGGMKPFCAIYSTFLQRGYDQVVHDVAIQRLPVRFAIDRAGLVGADGATHAGAFDISFLTNLPGFVVMAAADEAELSRMVATAVGYDDGPIAFRFPRGEGVGCDMPETAEPLEIGKGRIVEQGSKVAILSFGTRLSEVRIAAETLAAQGIRPTIADARFAKPLDSKLILQLAADHDVLITIEEGVIGGFGSHVAQLLAEEEVFDHGLKFRSMVLPDTFIDHASPTDMYLEAKLSAEDIHTKVLDALGVSKLKARA